MIKRFDRWHHNLLGGRSGHRFEAIIDNGFSSPDEFPREYRDVYEEVMGLSHGSENVPTDLLDEIQEALRRVTVAALTVVPRLEVPFPDDPRWSPWTRFMEPAAERAHQACEALKKARTDA